MTPAGKSIERISDNASSTLRKARGFRIGSCVGSRPSRLTAIRFTPARRASSMLARVISQPLEINVTRTPRLVSASARRGQSGRSSGSPPESVTRRTPKSAIDPNPSASAVVTLPGSAVAQELPQCAQRMLHAISDLPADGDRRPLGFLASSGHDALHCLSRAARPSMLLRAADVIPRPASAGTHLTGRASTAARDRSAASDLNAPLLARCV